MDVPVIMALPTQEPLEMSARSSGTASPLGIPSETLVPSGVVVDREFSAVPIGSGQAGAEETAEFLSPEVSENFAVRGTVQVDNLEDVPEEQDGVPIFADPQIDHFLTCAGDPAVGTHADVEQKLNLNDLHAAGLDGSDVAIAILDTGINLEFLKKRIGAMPRLDAMNSWAPPGVSGVAGKYPVGHGTMCAFDALIAAPRATLLDFPVLLGSAPGGAAMGRRLSIALLGYAQLLAFWAVAFAAGGGKKYKALVVNNSWGMYHPSWDFPPGHPGRYSDNPNHPFNIVVSTLARSNADILFAAGNCGSDCPDGRCQSKVDETIAGANALDTVLTVAGCDINDSRVGYSSQGPAIAKMAPNKPDVTAYTHFIGSQYAGKNAPDTGTSTSCPVVAGCIGALRSVADPVSEPPASIFAQLCTTARQVHGNAWNADYGHGIVDPKAAAQSLGLLAGT